MRWTMVIGVSVLVCAACEGTPDPAPPLAKAQPPAARQPQAALRLPVVFEDPALVLRPPGPVLSLPQGRVEYHFPPVPGAEPVWRLVRPDGQIAWRQKGFPYQGTTRVSMAHDQGRLFLLQWHPRFDEPMRLGAYDLRDGRVLWTASPRAPYGVLGRALPHQQASLALGVQGGRVHVRARGSHHDEELEVDGATGHALRAWRTRAPEGPQGGAGGQAVALF